MAYRKLTFVALLGLLAWAGLPDTSHAQRYYGGRGYGYGGRGVYVGTGYGYGGYGRGYYGPGWGGYYGPNYGYGYGYRPGFGAGVVVGSALSGGYYSGGNYYNSNGVVYSQPSGVATSSYQSFYPSDGSTVSTSSVASSDCCCNAGPSSYLAGSSGTAFNQAQDGRGTVVVSNVPANAELYWNGSRVMATGTVRRFGTSPIGNDGAVQKFEARWMGTDGKMVTQAREIRAQANQTVNLDWANSDRAEESSAPDRSNPNQNPNPNQIQNQNQNPNPNPQNTNPNPNKDDR